MGCKGVATMTLGGLIMIVFGVLYLRQPTMYRRGIWMKTSIAIRTLSEDGYKKYMRSLGVVFIVVGSGLVLWDQARRFL
jgi:hypothetical protein